MEVTFSVFILYNLCCFHKYNEDTKAWIKIDTFAIENGRGGGVLKVRISAVKTNVMKVNESRTIKWTVIIDVLTKGGHLNRHKPNNDGLDT